MSSSKKWGRNVLNTARTGLTALALLQFSVAGPIVESAQAHDNDGGGQTRTPIKHVIIIAGENRSFDHIFATYQPKGQLG